MILEVRIMCFGKINVGSEAMDAMIWESYRSMSDKEVSGV